MNDYIVELKLINASNGESVSVTKQTHKADKVDRFGSNAQLVNDTINELIKKLESDNA
jgi:hypothetical protein